VLVSKRKDGEAALRFFHRALSTLRVTPTEIVTDAAPTYPRVLDELVPSAWHHVEEYENNRIEADHSRRIWPSLDRAGGAPGAYATVVRIDLVTVVVDEYDPAIAFFTETLGFHLAEDSPSLTNDGRPKRWVVVRPPGAQTGILLARADGDEQRAAAGNQVAGRVGFFLRVDDFDAAYQRMTRAGITFITEPRT
jgi:catechol 2,3-dioxygenase-like lactoylglutathione lyase family enzyme